MRVNERFDRLEDRVNRLKKQVEELERVIGELKGGTVILEAETVGKVVAAEVKKTAAKRRTTRKE